ncbi:MAG TPA: hypothetical protein VK645_08295 [Chitinophagaceae bacterium]|nr:hypothetical protein [Chitinophagaceae bacterium]
MKKKSAKKKIVSAEKSIFRIAGEAIGTIGHEIAEGKDKLVEASQAAVEKINSVKKSISKKISKKTAKAVTKKKPAPARKIAKKLVKKIAKKTKSAPKKTTKKAAAKNKK